MDSGDNSPSEQQQPFWSSVQAPESTTPTQPEPQSQVASSTPTQPEPQSQVASSTPTQPEPQTASPPQSQQQSVSPPQAQMIGNIAQQPETYFSATVSNPAQMSGQFNSASSITGGYNMPEKKKGANWGHFALGFFAPIAVMIILSAVLSGSNGAFDDRWDDLYKYENATMISQNGTFTHTFDDNTTDYGRYAVDWCMSVDSGEYEYSCDWNENRDEGFEISETLRGEWDNNRLVGNYYSQNNTIWLTTDSHNYSEIEFRFDFIDEELEQELESEYPENSSLGDSLICFIPLIAIVAIAVSFSKGNKSLGWGLITSTIGIPLVLFGIFFTLLMLYGF